MVKIHLSMTSGIHIKFITESLFTESILAGFKQAEIEYGITDNTNLTTWDVQVFHLQIKKFTRKHLCVSFAACGFGFSL